MSTIESILNGQQVINILSAVSLSSTTTGPTELASSVPRHVFNSISERDNYFQNNLRELINSNGVNTVILVGTQFQIWRGLNSPISYDSDDWEDEELVITERHFFNNNEGRDNYFQNNLDELFNESGTQTFIIVGTQLQQWEGASNPPTYNSALWLNVDDNLFTNTEKTKLADIEDKATADQTGTEIVTLLETLTNDDRLDATAIKNLPSQTLLRQVPVLSLGDNDPPGVPALDDRYVIGTSPTGAWAGQANNIAQWNGSSWDFTTSLDGFIVLVDDESSDYQFNGTIWIRASAPIDLSTRSVTELSDVSSAGSGQIITTGERTNVSASIKNATLSGQVITFTRNDNTTFDVTITSTPTTPTTRPDLEDGELVELRNETFDASSGSFPSSAQAGYLYRVSANGTVDSVTFDIHDMLLALVDGASTTTFPNNWLRIEGDEGVSSWGALEGVIDDTDIISVLNRLGFEAVASVSNLVLNDITDRITEEADLTGQHSITFNVNNPQVFTACVLNINNIFVHSFDLNTLTQGSNTIDINISGGEWSSIIAGSPAQLDFEIDCTLRNGTTTTANKTVQRQTLSDHEFTYWGNSATASPTVPEQQAANQVESDIAGVTFDIVTTTASGQFLFILAPADRDVVSIIETNFNVNVTNTFTRTANERQINSVNFNLYTLGPSNGVEADFRVTLT